MIHKLTVDKSIVIKYKDQQLAVNGLPENIQNEIATLDKFRQDKIDLAYEMEKVDLAIQFKIIMLNKLINDNFDPPKVNTKEEDSSEQEVK